MLNRRSALIAAAFAVSTLSACGGSDAEAPQSSDGPLAELFGYSSDPETMRAQELKVQEAVAQCMRDAGWEYTPVDYSAMMPAGANEQFDDPKAFAEKYGYGFAHNYELYERPGAEQPMDTAPMVTDPNQDYMNGLSPDEMQHYQEALYGVQSMATTDMSAATEYVPPPLEEMGCQGKAQAEVYGGVMNDPDMSNRMSELYQQMESDPRMQDAYQQWSDCVYEADDVWDFLNPNDIYQYFDDYKHELQGLHQVSVDPNTGEPTDPLPEGKSVFMTTVDENGVGVGWAGKQKEISQADLDTLQREELDLYKVDQRCQKEAGLVTLRTQIEQEAADTLKAEFPDLTAPKG